MSLKLFDTATRTVRQFEPLVPGKVGIYLCGATVQSSPHIGHLRSAIAFDVLVRWLRRTGYDVTFVRNVTDIDDKILSKAAENDADWWAWALKYEREFTEAYDTLNITPPDYEPRATGHILDMIEIIERLIERGHAYRDPSGSADVWFDVPSFADYGALTHQDPAEMLSAGDGGESTKRDPRDFALWKAAKAGEPATASWPTPFGRGRPGWHIECSAMARRYLGDSFDIHAGGLDLRFPHHENEQAQSRAAGFGFAQYWLHNAWVTASGEKMSKSLGNSMLVSNILQNTSPQALRYALGIAQYRSMIEFTPDSLPEAASAWERLSGFIQRASELVAVDPDEDLSAVELRADFTAAMNDDLNVSAALAIVHEELREGNQALTDVDLAAVSAHVSGLRAMLDVLGLDPLDPAWNRAASSTATDTVRAALDRLVSAQLVARDEARAARDFATADAIRDQLAQAGIVVEDSVRGARWSIQQGEI